MSVAKKALYDLVNGIWVETTHPRGSQPDEAIAQLKSDKSKLIKKASNYKTKRDLLDTQINLEKAKRKFPHICNIVNEFLGIQTIAAPVEVIAKDPFVDRRADNRATDQYILSAFASTPPTISGLSDSQSAGTLAPTTSRGHGEPAPSRP